MDSNTKDIARMTGLFASFAFLQYTVLNLANHAGEGFLTSMQRDHVYYGLQVSVILGFLIHAVIFRIFSKRQIAAVNRKRISYTVLGLFFACMAAMLMTGTDSIFYVAVSMAAVLCLGAVCGAVHLRMSLNTLRSLDTAKCMGIGSAAAILLQYLLQIKWGISPLLPVFMLGSLIFMAYTLSDMEQRTCVFEIERPEAPPPRRILTAIIITTAFAMFLCFYNEYIHHLQIQSAYGAYNVYNWPRLMLVPVYLLFAFIGNRRKGKFVPITALCILLISLMNVVLAGNPGAYWLNMCLFYCSIAAFSSYYLLSFWQLAPGTANPAFWAPFGRMIDSGIVLFAGGMNISSFPAPVILGADILGVAVVILMMALGGDFNLAEEKEAGPVVPAAAPVPLPKLSPEEGLLRMRERYQLSMRETEVLRELVLTEDKQTVISERLGIQVRTLQNHVTQLYRKTGTTTRSGLTELYHENRNKG